MGCAGGLPSHAFQYIHDNNMTTDDVYPYTAKDGACTYDPKTASISIPFPGSVNITIGDEVELMQALFSVGPVAISFQVLSSLYDYKSGVYSDAGCGTGPGDVNHAVLAVGYGYDSNAG